MKLPLFFFFPLILIQLAHGVLSQNINSVTRENPFYLLEADGLDGDPDTNFHGFDTTFSVTVSNTSILDSSHLRFYRVRYRLMAENNGSPIPVTLSNGLSNGFSTTQFVNLAAGISTTTFDLKGLVIPQDQLDAKETYYILAQLQSAPFVILTSPIYSDVVGITRDSSSSQVFEFDNTASDAPYNIDAVPYGMTWTKTHALATDPTDHGFGVALGVYTLRYDNFNQPVSNLTAEVTVDFDLIEQSTGNQIPLVNDGIFTQTANAPSYDNSGSRPLPVFFGPTIFGFIFDVQLVPDGVQMNSVNETYYVQATVRHTEDPNGTQEVAAVCEIPAQQLLHFNGNLSAGSQPTIVSEFHDAPTPGTTTATYVNASIRLATGAGQIPNRPDVVFGNNNSLNVRLFADGRMVLVGGSQPAFLADNSGNPITCPTMPGVNFNNVSIGTFGFRSAGYTVQFPQGIVFFPNLATNRFAGQSFYTAGTLIPLDATLCPLSSINANFGTNAAVADESHPLVFDTNQFTVSLDGSLEFEITNAKYSHQKAYEILDQLLNNGQLDHPSMAVRCSNEKYFLNIVNANSTLNFTTASDGTARLNTEIEVANGSFQTHFPKKTDIAYANSTINFSDGEISATNGSRLRDVTSVKVPYFQTCPGDDCTKDVLPVTVTQIPRDSSLIFTSSGGLHAESDAIDGGSGHQLEWGKRSPTAYAHRTGKFGAGNFYMPGYQLYATSNALLSSPVYTAIAADSAASALLLSGFNRDYDNPDLHLPSETTYRQGNGDYAGLTFEVQGGGMDGASRLAGAVTDYAYELFPDQDPSPDGNQGSKYYLRESGVSGRQVGTDGTYDPSLNLHGFPCKISQFQLSFLENTNEAAGCTSWVDGTIEVSGFSNWTQIFTGLRFDCLGEPGKMTPDLSKADGKSLTYWNSNFDLKALHFITYEKPEGVCPKKFEAKLAAGAKTQVSHVTQPLFGTLAFCPDGNLSTLKDALDNPEEFNNITSQLSLPANISLSGPNKDYNLVTSSKLRFNNPTASGAPPSPRGFVTFAATIDIPYFRDLEVQAITTASGNPGAPFALTPGWDDDGDSFFNQSDFDKTHRGFPTSGISYEDYRNPKFANSPVPDTFLIKAEQDLFGFIPLKYPLFWDDNTRRFASNKAVKNDIFVAKMEHKIDWMDAKFTNVSFGATYDGLPQLKISNWLNGQIDAAADAIAQKLDTGVKAGIDKALDELDKMLEDSLERLIDPLIDTAAGSQVDPGAIRLLYRRLEAASQSTSTYADDYGTFRSQLETWLNDPADSIFNSFSELQALRDHLCTLSDAGGDVSSFLTQIDKTIIDIIKGIDYLTNGINNAQDYTANLEAPSASEIDVRGFLYKNVSGEREFVNAILDLLLTELVEPEVRNILQPLLESATSELNAELNALLTDIDPTLDQIKTVLLQVRDFLEEAHAMVQGTNAIAQKITTMIDDMKSGAYLNDLLKPVTTRAWNRFLQIEQALGIPQIVAAGATLSQVADDLFDNYTEDEFVDLIKSELKAAILGSEIVKQMQFLLRQTLYDIGDKVTSSLQSVLAEISNAAKEVISSTIGALEDEINPVLGEVSKYMGSGEISGYAEFNGDSLRKLRLDAKMQFEIPEEMSLHVYLEILSYSSEDNFVDSGCVKAGEKVVEVRIGAKDVSIEWISECKINLEVKLTLKDLDGEGGAPPLPVGVGGTFELSDGEIDFEAFKILEFGATIAIGIEEAYLGAKARAIFSDYQVAAGIFFGRTCTLEPLLFVDPDIGDVVTAGTTFTGAYVYGEVWLPISQLILGVPPSCLFRIDAGVGAGAFYFLEGPTYGGKIFLGVSGEALCVVSIYGEIKIILASQAGVLRGAGSGKFTAKIGPCPFCLKFKKSVKLLFNSNSGWSMQ